MSHNGLKANGPWLAITYNPDYTETQVDLEVAVPLAEPFKRKPGQAGDIVLRMLEGASEMASVAAHG